MDQYTETCFKLSRTVTRDYSTSFSLGIRMLDRKMHCAIYAIYGFVRIADEIVDTFYEHDRASLLRQFRLDTEQALREKISANPVLQAFQHTVHRYGIDRELIDAFLDSMEMDLNGTTYNSDTYRKYIYGSAEVVGLMCLRVFCNGDRELYDGLVPSARKLGAAFQKVNFLRDLKSDFQERGRMYFPGIDMQQFNNSVKKEIEDDIENDFREARAGIRMLPHGSRLGVSVAYIYYKALLNKIRMLPASRVQHARIRVHNFRKFLLLFQTWVRFQLRML